MTKSYHDLSLEIGEWAQHNFDVHLPHLGVAEEIGELTHAVLKREQKIRGQALTQTDQLIVDAISDAGIYLLHYAYKHDVPISPDKDDQFLQEFDLLGLLHREAGELIVATTLWTHTVWVRTFNHLFGLLERAAAHYGHDLLTIVNQTWNEVSKRDWRKFPADGLSH